MQNGHRASTRRPGDVTKGSGVGPARRADLSVRRSPMPGAQLVLHVGAKEVSRDELASVEAPPPTRTWFPIRHSHVLDAVLETVDQSGFTVEKMRLALS